MCARREEVRRAVGKRGRTLVISQMTTNLLTTSTVMKIQMRRSVRRGLICAVLVRKVLIDGRLQVREKSCSEESSL